MPDIIKKLYPAPQPVEAYVLTARVRAEAHEGKEGPSRGCFSAKADTSKRILANAQSGPLVTC